MKIPFKEVPIGDAFFFKHNLSKKVSESQIEEWSGDPIDEEISPGEIVSYYGTGVCPQCEHRLFLRKAILGQDDSTWFVTGECVNCGTDLVVTINVRGVSLWMEDPIWKEEL